LNILLSAVGKQVNIKILGIQVPLFRQHKSIDSNDIHFFVADSYKMNWKRLGRRLPWHNRSIILEFASVG
jgi:hypothetical protein